MQKNSCRIEIWGVWRHKKGCKSNNSKQLEFSLNTEVLLRCIHIFILYLFIIFVWLLCYCYYETMSVSCSMQNNWYESVDGSRLDNATDDWMCWVKNSHNDDGISQHNEICICTYVIYKKYGYIHMTQWDRLGQWTLTIDRKGIKINKI